MDIGICNAVVGFEQGAEVNGLWLEKAKGIKFPQQRRNFVLTPFL